MLLWCPLFICWRSSITRFFLQGFLTNYLLPATPLNNFISHHFVFFSKIRQNICNFGKFTAKLALALAGHFTAGINGHTSFTLVVQLELQISSQIFEKIRKGTIRIIKGPDVDGSWKKTWCRKSVTLFMQGKILKILSFLSHFRWSFSCLSISLSCCCNLASLFPLSPLSLDIISVDI